jgi:ATP-dependent RNA helicase RhlE
VALSGELSQSERNHALQALRDGRAKVCVATDVAARGIDLPGLNLVIHAELPNDAQVLQHRSGRTGRAGKKGVATTFVMPQEKSDARKLERELKIKFEWREADKNLEKELRNQPIDTSTKVQDLLMMETRSWKGNDPVSPMASTPSPYRSAGNGNGFRSRGGNGGGFSGGRNAGGRNNSRPNSRPGSSRSGPARRGQ